jgi:peptidyl-dipeptidase Dcp
MGSKKERPASILIKEHPSILYKRFRGRDAEPDALLKRAGLV